MTTMIVRQNSNKRRTEWRQKKKMRVANTREWQLARAELLEVPLFDQVSDKYIVLKVPNIARAYNR